MALTLFVVFAVVLSDKDTFPVTFPINVEFKEMLLLVASQFTDVLVVALIVALVVFIVAFLGHSKI